MKIQTLIIALLLPLTSYAQDIRGDMNRDGNLSVTDVTMLVNNIVDGTTTAVEQEPSDKSYAATSTNINTKLSVSNKVIYTLGSSFIRVMGDDNLDAQGVGNWTLLKTATNAREVYNLAIDGSSWQSKGRDADRPDKSRKRTWSASNQAKWLIDITSHYGYPSPDIIFLQFTNDLIGISTDNLRHVMSMSFQELEDDEQERREFCAAFRYTIELLYKHFPKATIFVSDGCMGTYQADDRKFDTYDNAHRVLQVLCNRFAIPLIPTLYECGIVDIYESTDGSGPFLYDGIHTNKQGKKLYSNYIANKLINMFYSRK